MQIIHKQFMLSSALAISVSLASSPLHADVSALMEKYNTLKAGEAAAAELAALQKQVDQLEADLRAERGKTAPADQSAKVKELQTTVDRLEKRLRAAKTGGDPALVARLQKRIDTLETQIRELGAKPKSAEPAKSAGAGSASGTGGAGAAAGGDDRDSSPKSPPKRGGAPPAPPSGGGAPPPPPLPGAPAAPGAPGAGKLEIPGFTEDMIEALQELKPDNYDGDFGKDGKFPPGLWESDELMESSEANKNLQAFGRTKKSFADKGREQILDRAKKNRVASAKLIADFNTLSQLGRGGFSDQNNHVVLRFMVDMVNKYKPASKSVKAIEWPNDPLTERSYSKLVKQVAVAFRRLKTSFEDQVVTEEKLAAAKVAEEQARAAAEKASKLVTDVSTASAADLSDNLEKIFSDDSIVGEVKDLFKQDLTGRGKKGQDIAGKSGKAFADALMAIYILPYAGEILDQRPLVQALSKSIVKHIMALRDGGFEAVSQIKEFMDADRSNPQKVAIAVWRAIHEIYMQQALDRYKVVVDDKPTPPEEASKAPDNVNRLLVYALLEEIDAAAQGKFDAVIERLEQNKIDFKTIEPEVKKIINDAIKDALSKVGIKGDHVKVLRTPEAYTFKFWSNRNDKRFKNPKTPDVLQVREGYVRDATNFKKRLKAYVSEANAKADVPTQIAPPSIDAVSADRFSIFQIPIDQTLYDALTEEFLKIVGIYYKDRYQALTSLLEQNKDARDLVNVAVADFRITVRDGFNRSLDGVMGNDKDYQGEFPEFIDDFLTTWILSERPRK